MGVSGRAAGAAIAIPPRLAGACLLIGAVFWLAAALRHALLQSNAYDLGLFDQWAWLLAQGQPPISSMEGVHVLADHAAWLFPLAGLAYRLLASVQWLLASQALALSFTAAPLWWLARQAGLTPRLAWLSCGLWWLQPVVFNVNLFDFHPETWAMPLLAASFGVARLQHWAPWRRWALWWLLLLLLLGCRDGLVLVVVGLGLAQLLQRRWGWGLSAIGLGLGWLALLSRWFYPLLRGSGQGPKAAGLLFPHLGSSLEEIVINGLTQPQRIVAQLDWSGALVYLLLLAVAVAPFWRRASLVTLSSAVPLVVVNLLSVSGSQRTLIHHYSLPIAVIAVVAAIDGLAADPPRTPPWRRLAWAALCWAALAKPWFFTGPYLQRLALVPEAQAAIQQVPAAAPLLTTSYLVPHLSHRVAIAFPQGGSTALDPYRVLLLHPGDPGWASSAAEQRQLLAQARRTGWQCQRYPSGLELCRRS